MKYIIKSKSKKNMHTVSLPNYNILLLSTTFRSSMYTQSVWYKYCIIMTYYATFPSSLC